MTSEEISKLHKRMDDRIKKRISEKYDTSVLDSQLASLVSMPGWEIMEDRADAMIAELLEYPEFDDSTSLAVRCSVIDGRRLAIEFIRSFISEVKTTYAAKKSIEKDEKKESENKSQ